jgi:predicted CXXCH cytochrome family protein
MVSTCRTLAIALLLAAESRGAAVDNYHAGESLVCSDCHSMHFSLDHGYEGGAVGTQPATGGDWLPPGGPNGQLLKLPRDQLCIACHDGGGVAAPAVIAPVTGDPAGGAFARTQSPGAPATGHVLGTPLPSGPTRELGCATCHASHGSGSFRNLRADPAGLGQQHTVVARPVLPEGAESLSDAARLEAAYASRNIVYDSGMSDWCRSCHATVHGHSGTPSTLDHPDGVALGDSPLVNIDSWLGTVESRVRTERVGGDGRPSRADKIFCLTCHRGHGSGQRASLIFSDGETLTSSCQQCHDE